MLQLQKILQHKYWWLAMIACFAAIIAISSLFHAKLDLTTEKRYSLSPSTKNLLTNLNEEVEIEKDDKTSKCFKLLCPTNNKL